MLSNSSELALWNAEIASMCSHMFFSWPTMCLCTVTETIMTWEMLNQSASASLYDRMERAQGSKGFQDKGHIQNKPKRSKSCKINCKSHFLYKSKSKFCVCLCVKLKLLQNSNTIFIQAVLDNNLSFLLGLDEIQSDRVRHSALYFT